MDSDHCVRIQHGRVGEGVYGAVTWVKGPYGWVPFGGIAAIPEQSISGEDDFDGPEEAEEAEDEGDLEPLPSERPKRAALIPRSSSAARRPLDQREARQIQRARRRAIRRSMRRAHDAVVGEGAIDLIPGAKQTLFLLDMARKLYRASRKGDQEAKGKFAQMLLSDEPLERRAAEAARKLFA